MSLTDLYRAAVLDHNRNPRNRGRAPSESCAARGLNAMCGDDIRVSLRVGSGGSIEAAAFEGEAGAITISSASMMTEAVRGQSVAGALALMEAFACLLRAETVSPELREELGELAALEGVRRYPSRIRAALLPWETLKAALEGREIASTE